MLTLKASENAIPLQFDPNVPASLLKVTPVPGNFRIYGKSRGTKMADVMEGSQTESAEFDMKDVFVLIIQ